MKIKHGIDQSEPTVTGEITQTDIPLIDLSFPQQPLTGRTPQQGPGRGNPLAAIIKYDIGIGGIGDIAPLHDEDVAATRSLLQEPLKGRAIGKFQTILYIICLHKFQASHRLGGIVGKIQPAGIQVIAEAALHNTTAEATWYGNLPVQFHASLPAKMMAARAVHALLVIVQVLWYSFTYAYGLK